MDARLVLASIKLRLEEQSERNRFVDLASVDFDGVFLFDHAMFLKVGK